jgi:signal transduction histidine kinase
MAQGAPVEVRHHVQFYEDTTVLAEQVAAFLGKALAASGTAIAIARPMTLAIIELELARDGHDVIALQRGERLAFIDATELVARIMVDALPDRARFAEHVGGVVRRFAAAGQLHIYGEAVDILWSEGNRAGVVTLERCWSELLREVPARLLCGYELRPFDRDIEAFELVCDHHDAVMTRSMHPTVTTSRVMAQLEQRAHALESEIARRTHLERRMAQLLDITGQLAAATDRETIAQLTVQQGAAAVGAVDGAIWLATPDRTQLQLIASSLNMHTKQAAEHYRTIALDQDTPLAQVVRTGEPIFLRSYDEYGQQFPASRERLARVWPTTQYAFAMLPIAIHERPLGAVVFTFDHEREFFAADRAFKAIVARQCGLALARVQQQQQEREARTEIELLYDLTASVNQSDDLAGLFELALATVRRGARCDRAAILLFDPDGVMRFKAAQGLSDTYRRAVEGHTPWQRDTGDPAPVTVDDTETDPAWASYRDVFRGEGIRALAFVPVLRHRMPIGKFMLYRNEPRPFSLRELQFASTVAVHIAQAVERKRADDELARAYRVERQAHLEAEEATRAREEILSVVSHDLRNPLGTILMGATSLLTVDVSDRSSLRLRTIGQRIHRQADRMARLIEDLVDFAGIQAGQLAIERKAHKPEDILTATSDIFSSMAEERGLRFESRAVAGLPAIECDSERAVQVFSNLVGNALKVTPRGGAIAIGAEPSEHEVVFFVHDTGPGIAADELPQLFERYWRSKHSQYKGAGLGLSIARGIVDAHGGRIWAESQPGRGTTFYFSLAGAPRN